MRVPVDSIQYLLDVFIEGGWAEEEDFEHLDAIYDWLHAEKDRRDRPAPRDVNPDYFVIRNMVNEIVSHVSLAPGYVVEPREWESPADMPVNRDGEDGPIDEEEIPENRGTYEIVDELGNTYFFRP